MDVLVNQNITQGTYQIETSKKAIVLLTANVISPSQYSVEALIYAYVDGVLCGWDRGVNANNSYQYGSTSCSVPVLPGLHTVALSGSGTVSGRLSVVQF